MKNYSFRSPAWVMVAAAAIFSQVFVILLVDPGLIQVAALGVASLVGFYLLRGSRIAWSVAAVGAAGQLVEAILGSQPWGVGILGVGVLGCLFIPSTLRFVWGKRVDRPRRPKLGRTQQKAHDLLYRILAVAAGWEASINSQSSTRSYRTLIWRLGASTLLLMLLVGMTFNWQQEAGDDVIPSLIADVVWTAYAVSQIAFLVVGALAAIRHFGSDRTHVRAGRAEETDVQAERRS